MAISIAVSIFRCRLKNESPLVTEIEANTFFHFLRKSENFNAPIVSVDPPEYFGDVAQHTFFQNFIWKSLLHVNGDLAELETDSLNSDGGLKAP